MSNKKIVIGTRSLKDAAKEFVDVWHKVEAKNAPKPLEKISFKDQRLLFKTLTPKRFELLEYLHEQGKMSIRALAKKLERDYSNVHQDVKILHQLGLILKDEEKNTYHVPWDVITTELSLTVKKESRDHRKARGYHSGHHAAHG